MKISKPEVDKMIKEEFQKMWKKRTLTKRLGEINESLSKMAKEDSLLNEVEASGMQKTSSATGLVPGEQPGVKFQKLNATTLKEDGEDDVENTSGTSDMGLDVDVDAPTMGGGDSTMGGSEIGVAEVAPMGEFEAKFAELGKSIDAKLGTDSGMSDVEAGTNAPGSDDFEEVQVDAADAPEASAETGEIGAIGASDTDKEEEFDEVKKEAVAQEAVVTEIEKTSEEGIGGESVAQDADLSNPNGDMKKDTVVSEGADKKGTIITEGSKTEKKNIFLEGKDSERQAKILAEQKRMRKFAGLSNEDEE